MKKGRKMEKTIIILLLGSSFFARAQSQQSTIKFKQFGVFAGIGLTNVFENNVVNIRPGFYNMPLKLESKPSLEIGITYTLPILGNSFSYKPELGFLTGRYVQNNDNNLNPPFSQHVMLDNHFETISLRSIAEINLPLIRNAESFLFGFGPTLNFTSPNSKTETQVDASNVWNLQYSNKFFLGGKAYIGISKNNSTIKLTYTYLKLNSEYRDIPNAPFYTLGIIYEHKIF